MCFVMKGHTFFFPTVDKWTAGLFKKSFPELREQFQPNLADIIVGWKGKKFLQKGPVYFMIRR